MKQELREEATSSERFGSSEVSLSGVRDKSAKFAEGEQENSTRGSLVYTNPDRDSFSLSFLVPSWSSTEEPPVSQSEDERIDDAAKRKDRNVDKVTM